MSDVHKTKAIKVWADIDVGIADLVVELNLIEGVRTDASCEGTLTRRGYVMAHWTPAALKVLRTRFDVTFPKNSNDTWGYIHRSPEDEQIRGR